MRGGKIICGSHSDGCVVMIGKRRADNEVTKVEAFVKKSSRVS
jgi:hypothetical protein